MSRRARLSEELMDAADRARAGAGAVFVLTGEAGIGKTNLVQRLAAAARDGLVVTWGRCTSDQAAPPLWPWRDVVPDGTAGVASNPTGDAIGAPRYLALSGLRSGLFERAREAPSLHIVEDLQWADVTSVLLLADVAAAAGGVPLLVIATVRSGEPVSAPLREATEHALAAAETRAVPPLDEGEVAELVRHAGFPVHPQLTSVLCERTGGNPFYVTELLRSVRSEGTPDEVVRDLAGDVPARVAEITAQRLGRLPAPVRGVVEAAAAIGASGAIELLAAVVERGAESLIDLMEQARAAGLVDLPGPGTWRFVHDLTRDAVYQSIGAGDRARLHNRALDSLARDQVTPAPVLAHHALAARPVGDPERAVALCARAGEAALAHCAYEEATTWFDRALAAAPPSTSDHWRAELLVACGEAHRQGGDRDRARASFGAAAELTDDADLLARAAIGFADPGADLGIAFRSHDTLTPQLLSRAIAAQGDADSLTLVRLEARLAAELYFSDDPDRSRVVAADACRRAERLDDPEALGVAHGLAHDAFVVGQRPMAEQLAGSAQLIDWCRATTSVAAHLTAHRARVFDLLAAGDIPAMESEVVAFRRIAEPLRSPGYLWWPTLWAAMRALLAGRLEEAEETAGEALTLGQAPFPNLAFFNYSFLLFYLRREQGRLDELEQATRDTAAANADIPAIRVALAFLLAEIGKLPEARGVAASLRHGADFGALRDRNWPASWFQLARVAFLARDAELGRALLSEANHPDEPFVMVSLATVCLGSTALGSAWAHAAVGDREAAAKCFAAAVEANGRIGAVTWEAQARADAEGTTASTPVTTSEPREAAVFRRGEAAWHIEFAGRSAQVPHSRGLLDLRHLLSHQAEAVSVAELLDEPLASGDRGADALDERARREIRSKLRELDDAEADADAAGDGERVALLREERQQLAEAVARDLGLGGRSRKVGDSLERTRKTVSTRIRRTIKQLGSAHPELGRHLERSVDTGMWCAYRPAEPVDWKF